MLCRVKRHGQNNEGGKRKASVVRQSKWACMTPKMDCAMVEQLHEAMKASHDQLCFIQYQMDGTMLPKWYLVQVNLDGTDLVLALTWGIYWCKWLVKCYKDSTKWLTWDCKFWPEVREVGEGNVLTRLVMVSPKRWNAFWGRSWARRMPGQRTRCVWLSICWWDLLILFVDQIQECQRRWRVDVLMQEYWSSCPPSVSSEV